MPLTWNLNSFTKTANLTLSICTKPTILDQLRIGNRIVCITSIGGIITIPKCYVRIVDGDTIQIWLTNDERRKLLNSLIF